MPFLGLYSKSGFGTDMMQSKLAGKHDGILHARGPIFIIAYWDIFSHHQRCAKVRTNSTADKQARIIFQNFANSDCSWFFASTLVLTWRRPGPSGLAGRWQVQDSKIMTLGRRMETTGCKERDYSDCCGDENLLPPPVSTFILTQDWSISPKYVWIGWSPADVSATLTEGH